MAQAESTPIRIAILLSTCNGAGYLLPLLESIEEQSWPHWDLWVRDDGSTDGTVEILEEFADRLKQENQAGTGNRVYVIRGENIGIVRSFFHLLEKAEIGYAGYSGYAFCDQDDIWLPAKLERAAQALKPDVPFLYHARQWLVDQKSGERALSPVPRHTGFANALIQNQVVGCTMVINQLLRECVLETLKSGSNHGSSGGNDGNISDEDASSSDDHANSGDDGDANSSDNHADSGDEDIKSSDFEPCAGIIMHDWWCYLLASAAGRIHYDPEPVILFRRHEESTTPVTTGLFRIIRKRLSALRNRNWSVRHIMQQAMALKRHYRIISNRANSNSWCRISKGYKQLLHSLLKLESATLIHRIGYLFTGKHVRAGKFDTAVFRLLVLFRRF